MTAADSPYRTAPTTSSSPAARVLEWARRRRRSAAIRRRPGSRRSTVVLFLTLVVLLGTFAWSLGYLRPAAPGRRVTLDRLQDLTARDEVREATFRDEDDRVVGVLRDGVRFWTSYPSSGAVTARMVEALERSSARVSVDPQSAKQNVRTVATFLLPLMVLANLFALLFAASRGGSSAIGEVMTFGSIGAKRLRRGEAAPVTFADVAGADEAVAELAEVRDYLRDPARYESLGAMPPKGVLLFGPPGVGKTLLAKAVAGEAGVPFFSVTGAEFVESLVGVGAARVRDLFARVRAVAPAIVFIDELDAAGRRRGVGGGTGGSDEREQTLNQLLVEMDGFAVSAGIVVIGATNRPDILDPALLRPGRFDRHVTLEAPDAEGRAKILALHARGRPVAADVDMADLARRTPGFTGADLANVVNEAALLAVRAASPTVESRHLDDAIVRVLHGPHRGRVLTDDDRRRLAVHEAGHAVVAAATGRRDDVHRVSILHTGRRLATTALASDDDAAVLTRTRLLAKLATTMAGLSAEVLVLGEPSTSAEDDLEAATELARDVIARYGMSERLGRARLLAGDAEVFLGESNALASVSDETHEALDREVRALLASAESDATRLLRSNRKVLDALVHRVLVEETLEGDELHAILVDARLPGGSATARPRAAKKA